MKTKLIPFFLLLLLPIIYAQEFDSYNLEISLTPSGLAHQKIESTFSLSQDAGSLLFSTDKDIQDVKVKDANFSLTNQGILINKEIKANEINNLFMEFESKGLVKQSGKDFIFSYDLSLPFNSKQTQITLALPEGYILSDVDSPISPKPKKIETDGKTINIIWGNINQESFIVIYKRGYTSKSESLIPLYTSFSIVIILLVAIVIILIYRKKTKEFISNTLNQDEKKIVSIIKEDKQITQKKISQLTEFSKSKMSKIVRRLEEKGIVKKKPFYKTNKFDLSKRLK